LENHSERILKLAILAALCISFAFTAKAETLEIVTEHLPPFNYLDDGVPKGIGTEVVQAVLKETDRAAPIQFLPWARSYQMALQTPGTLIYSILRTPEREKKFAWIGKIAPYGVSLYQLVHDNAPDLSSLEDARPLRIGVYFGDAKAEFLQANGFTNLSSVENDRLNLRKLLLKRIDLMIIDDAVINELIELEGVDPSKIRRALPIQELSGYAYMAFQKDTNPKLVEEFRRGLEKVKETGVFDAILEEYYLIN
jgi:polar amino acid transport system substrate-binding protein